MAEHQNHYSKEKNPNARYYVGDVMSVDLFPYKIKNRSLFYDRNHPVQLHPESTLFQNYWNGFIEKCIEGRWINDEGTWVFMMPKLFYYINFQTILDKKRRRIKPELTDLEWTILTYFLCIDGFSGFEGDEKYTCFRLIERIERGEKLDPIELEGIPEECKHNGKYKKYIHPWTYLTRTYLIDDPRGPLGRPLYHNDRSNGMIYGCRGSRKSFCTYHADFMHEWSFSGVQKMEDIGEVNAPLLFGMGSGTKDALQRTINNIKGFYDSQPGKYKYDDPKIPDYMGPLYKNYQGTLDVGKDFQHIIKDTRGNVETLGSLLQLGVLTPDRQTIGAGDRFRRQYVEEGGFVGYLDNVYAVNRDSLRLGDYVTGSFVTTGTSGDLISIVASIKMWNNPGAYEIFGIPDYFKNTDREIPLFLSAVYTNRAYDDGQGNILHDLSLANLVKKREKMALEKSSEDYRIAVAFNPINPDEMLVPSRRSILPTQEAQRRRSDVIAYKVFETISNVGSLTFDPTKKYGVSFEKDTKKELAPILDYTVDIDKIDTRGAVVIHEPPDKDFIPPYLYWILYDPAARSGSGTSFHAALVYKHFYGGGYGKMSDTFVAEWIGRHQNLDDNYKEVIKLAKYYNARIFPEINVAGFVEWCKKNNYYDMLQRDSYEIEKEISPGSKRNHYRVGFQMLGRKKFWCEQKYSDWLTEERIRDEKTGVPLQTGIDTICSLRLLDETIHYDDVGNFDLTSAALGLPLLLGQLEHMVPKTKKEEDPLDNIPMVKKQPSKRRKRSSFENF